MSSEEYILEAVHWFSTGFLTASLVASKLIQVIPTPSEISWKPYVVIYNTVQRLSVAARKQWSGNGNGNGPVHHRDTESTEKSGRQ